jgi:hypothetical protein
MAKPMPRDTSTIKAFLLFRCKSILFSTSSHKH